MKTSLTTEEILRFLAECQEPFVKEIILAATNHIEGLQSVNEMLTAEVARLSRENDSYRMWQDRAISQVKAMQE